MYFFRLFTLFIFFITSLYSYSYDVKKPPISQKRFSFQLDAMHATIPYEGHATIPYEGHATIPYEGNYSLNKKNTNITRLVVAIHSSNHDANFYFKNTFNLASKLHTEQNTLIVSPQFLLSSLIDSPVHANYLYWRVYPFLGSSMSTYKNHKARISAYEVLDTLIDKITQKGNFSNLKEIVIFGHSAGGQFVNRYCAYNRFQKNGLYVHYIVMAPSSYLYFDNKRPIGKNSSLFKKVPIQIKKYNSWGHGLENLYRVHRKYKITPDMMRKQYAKSNVTYLVGAKDNDPNNKSLSTTQASNLQGSNRLQRMLFYKKHLQSHFGEMILLRHQFFIIPNVGHSSKGLMNSKKGKETLFPLSKG